VDIAPVDPSAARAAGGQGPPRGDLIDTAAAGPAAVRGGVLRTAGYVAGLLLSLAAAPLLIRHLGTVDFGRYAAALAVVSIVAGLSDGGVNTIALRELSVLDGEQRRRMMSDLLGLRLVLAAAGLGIAVAFAAVAGYGGSLVLGTGLAGVGMFVIAFQTLLGTVLQSQLRFGWAVLTDVIRQAVVAGAIVALVLSDGGVVSFLAVTIPGGAVGLACTVLLVRRQVSLRPALHLSRWLPLLSDTFTYALAIAVNSLYFRVTLVLMSLVAVPLQTGYFAVSFRVMEVLVGVPVLLMGAAFPILSRSAEGDRDRFQYGAERLWELGFVVGVLATLAVQLGAGFAIDVVAGAGDAPAIDVLRIESLGLLAIFVAVATGFPLLALRRHRETLLANCLSLVVGVALTLALSPSMGAQGGAIAAVLADFMLATINTVMLIRAGGPRLPLKVIPIALLAGAVGYGAGLAVGVHPVVQAGVGSAVYILAVAAMGYLPPELKSLPVIRRVGGRPAETLP